MNLPTLNPYYGDNVYSVYVYLSFIVNLVM